MKKFREDLIRQKYRQVWERTQLDAEYARMFREMDELEPRYESVMEKLSDEIQDVIRDYVTQCEGMSGRMLECACEEIVFPYDIWDDAPLPSGGWPACRIMDLKPENLAKIRDMPYNQSIRNFDAEVVSMSFSDLVKERYSVRKFDARPIEPEKMDLILQAGRLAPTGCNYQPQRVLVLQGEDLQRSLDCTPFKYDQQAVLVVCYDRNESWKSRTGREIGDVDGTIVLTQMMYQAQELGIGSLIVGMYKEPMLRARFNIPENYVIVSLLMLGYPAQDCQPHPQLHFERKELEKTVFYGSF